MPTVLDPRIHHVKTTPISKFFGRRLHDSDIMTFFHRETEQWILAYWLNRKRKWVEEIEDLGSNFEYVTETFVSAIVSCYGQVDFGRFKKKLISNHRDRIRKDCEELQESQETWDWAKKRVQHKAPVPFMFSAPVSGGRIGTPRVI